MELYKGQAGSPITYLAADISANQTTITIADDSALPDAPNIATIGYGEHLETIKYGIKSNGVLQNVTRGIEGTPRAWPTGTEVARFFTAYDHNSIIENFNSHLADSVTDDAHGWNSALRFKAGTFSRNTTLGSGTQIIDGLGFKPKAIIALALVSQGVGRMSIGVYDGNRSMGLLDGYNNTANAYISHVALIAIRQGTDSSTQYTASVASVNDDGFVLNWQKGSSVTDGENIIVHYLAFR